MAEPQHHALSDLLDGQLDADQTEVAIDSLLNDPALAEEWWRMHQLRSLMRNDVDPSFDVRDAVRDAIKKEPTFLLPALAKPTPPRRWKRHAMGAALAASVALVTVAGIRPWQTTPPPALVAAESGNSAVEVATVAANSKPNSPTPRINLLDSYWAVHADNTLLAGPESLSPLVRHVSTNSQR